MAKTPITAKQAQKLSNVLVPDKKAANQAADMFWSHFLDFGEQSELKIPNKPADQSIRIEKVDGEPWLIWHGLVTITIRPGLHLNIFVTTMDAPGKYRMDFTAMGLKKKEALEVKTKFADSIRKAQKEIQSLIDEDEKEEFKRIMASTKEIPQEFRPGMRESDSLVGRLLLDNVQMSKLWERSGELQYAVLEVAKLILHIKDEKEKTQEA